MSDTKAIIAELTKKHGAERKSLMPILQGVVEKQNYLSKDAMREVAETLDISAAEVFGTASFYSFLDTEKRGKYKIRVCKSITCDMKGKREIVQTMEHMLKLKVGETTEGGRFSLLETNCIGLCDQGPAMLINDELHTKLTTASVKEILGDYIRNKY